MDFSSQITNIFIDLVVKFWPFILLIFFIFLLKLFFGNHEKENKLKYDYKLKHSVMTDSEFKFYKALIIANNNQYDIFPQVHLDSFLEYKIRGQSWIGAFKHINQKSVDFVLCNKSDGQPILAIELDDPSHQREDRVLRDEEVERIFKSINLPLLRIKDQHTFEHSYTAEGIAQQIYNLLKK